MPGAKRLTRLLAPRLKLSKRNEQLVGVAALQGVAIRRAIKELADVRMADRRVALIRHEIALGNIGHIVGLIVLREEMIVRLVLSRTQILRNGFIPLFCIGEDRIRVEDNAAKFEKPVFDDLTDLEFRLAPIDGKRREAIVPIGLGRWRLDRRLGRRYFAVGLRRRIAAKQPGYAVNYVVSMAHHPAM